jgi:hypothetical protein
MVYLTRTGKEPRNWSAKDLTAYNITICAQGAEEFFGRQPGPIDHLDPDFLSTGDPTLANSFSRETYHFLSLLDMATRQDEIAIHDFAKIILEVVGFDKVSGRIVRTRLRSDYITLTTPDDDNYAADIDVALMHSLSYTILLFVQLEDESYEYSEDHPEPQLIAKAIAAFQQNNYWRKGRFLRPIDKMTIPCITMVGTRPSFFKVPVSLQLSDCVASGKYPPEPTIVTRCDPPAPRRLAAGMGIPEYRRTALEYYNAFLAVAEECWTAILVGLP